MKERLINTRFWSDGFIREKLNPLDRYLYLYLLTNEKTNISGIYELPKTIMSWETGIEEKTLLSMLKRLAGKVEYIDGWIILVNFLKYQRTASGSVVVGINKSLKEAPEHIIKYAFDIGYGDGTPIIPPSSHISESESESESESSFVNETSFNKPSTEKGWRDLRRVEAGKTPTRTPRSDKQVEVFAAIKWKDYFREQGHSQHGMQFFRVKNENREKIVSKLVITASREVDMKGLIDWWFQGAGEWAEYEPEQCFSSKTLEKFLNKGKVIPKNKQSNVGKGVW